MFMLNLLAVSLLSSAAAVEAIPVDVTEVARQHRAWAAGPEVRISSAAYDHLVAWSDSDSDSTDIDTNADDRLDSLLASGSLAIRDIRLGQPSAMFIAEYADRQKRGNPRRIRLGLSVLADASVLIDYL